MWPLAEVLIGLIGLLALDDAIEGRPPRHTWAASFALIGALAVLMAAAVGAGRLIS